MAAAASGAAQTGVRGWRSYELSDSDKAFVEALAGAVGSVVGTWCFYPLDTVKTRYQASTRMLLRDGTTSRSAKSMVEVFRKAVHEEGASVLYNGIGVKTLHSLTQSFVYFYTFASLRRAWEARTQTKIGIAANLFVGVLAGWCNVLLTEPLDTLATSRQTQTSLRSAGKAQLGANPAAGASDAADAGVARGSSGAAEKKADAEIVPASPKEAAAPKSGLQLYRSIWVSLLLTCNPAMQYTAFEQAKRRLLASRGPAGRELTATDAFVLGAASKALATILTYPAIRAKVLLQTGRSQSTGVVGTIHGVVSDEGPSGLYKGLPAQLFKTVLVAALMLMVKEKAFGAAFVSVAWVQSKRHPGSCGAPGGTISAIA